MEMDGVNRNAYIYTKLNQLRNGGINTYGFFKNN